MKGRNKDKPKLGRSAVSRASSRRQEIEDVPLVSVVIPVRNEMGHIERCLQSLAEQEYPAQRLEIIVVDGDSTDGCRQWLETATRRWPQVRVLDNPGRIVAKGLNIGIRQARGEVIVILSGHSHVAKDFVRNSVSALQETGADAVGGPLTNIGDGQVGQAIAVALSSPLGAGDSFFRYSRRPGWVQSVAYGAYRRDVFDHVGLFDETMPRSIDDEFNYRLIESGGRLWLSPAIRSFYYNRATLPGLFWQYLRSGFWKVRVIEKHPSQMRLRHLGPLVLVGVLASSGALSLWKRQFRPFLGLAGGTYAATLLLASLLLASRKGWRHLPLLPLAFASIHLGYGLGFLGGLLSLASRRLRQRR